MSDLFVYGTLRDAQLRGIVLDRAVEAEPARLTGHAIREGREGLVWPSIVAVPGAEAEGLLLRGLTAADRARLDYYEGGFGYDTRTVRVETSDGPAKALCFFEEPTQGGAPWSLTDWQDRWGAVSRRAAREAMECYRPGRDSVAALMPFFRNRAWAGELAREGAPATVRSAQGMGDVEVLSVREGYDGFFRLRPFNIRYRRFDGDWGEVLSRECFLSYDVALVLPYDPATDQVLLVEQVRFGPIHRSDPRPWVLEPVAGMVDAGETPEAAARRECIEEAGLDLHDLLPLSKGYSSPGYSTEFCHNYIGLCDLSGREALGLSGLDCEHEDIRNHILPFKATLSLIETGEINAVPLQALLWGLASRREALLGGA